MNRLDMTAKQRWEEFTHCRELILARFWPAFSAMIGKENPFEAFEAMIEREKEYRNERV